MSRTYKTDPIWVALRRGASYIEHHWSCDRVHCDADLEFKHVTNRPRTEWSYNGRVHYSRYWPLCTWQQSSESHYRTYHQRYCRGSNRAERRDMWYGPSRSEERSRLTEAIKEYRANGDIDHVELEHQQHRHNTDWYID